MILLEPTTDPQGKCSHGGKFDTSASTSAAVGGINKETVTANYSPLFQEHGAVAELAIKHTAYVFAGQSNFFQYRHEQLKMSNFIIHYIYIYIYV